MYKIMTKLHTITDDVYRFYTIIKDGKRVEYETDDVNEVISTALELMKFVGYKDLKVVEDKDYYIEVEKSSDPGIQTEDLEELLKLLAVVGSEDLTLTHDAEYNRIWNGGKRPDPQVDTYTLTISGINIIAQPSVVNNIKSGDNVVIEITFIDIPTQGHFNINGQDVPYTSDIVDIEELETDIKYKLTFKNITENKNIIIVEDRA